MACTKYARGSLMSSQHDAWRAFPALYRSSDGSSHQEVWLWVACPDGPAAGCFRRHDPDDNTQLDVEMSRFCAVKGGFPRQKQSCNASFDSAGSFAPRLQRRGHRLPEKSVDKCKSQAEALSPRVWVVRL